MQRAVLFVALLTLLGCGNGHETKQGELAYLSGEQGKYPKRDSVLESQPLKGRLQALLGSRYDTYLKNWDAEGPLEPNADQLFATGCVSHFCDKFGSALHVDFAKDELIALMRIKQQVEVFREKEGGLDSLPTSVREWIGQDRFVKGEVGPETPPEEATGYFAWKTWADAPLTWKGVLKKIKVDGELNVYQQADQATAMPCDVRLARCDLDGDGLYGTIVTYSCDFWCGQVGCAFHVYEGGKEIHLVDVIDEVQPGKGGVITSKGVLMELK